MRAMKTRDLKKNINELTNVKTQYIKSPRTQNSSWDKSFMPHIIYFFKNLKNQ